MVVEESITKDDQQEDRQIPSGPTSQNLSWNRNRAGEKKSGVVESK
jgi:hypothetical protein